MMAVRTRAPWQPRHRALAAAVAWITIHLAAQGGPPVLFWASSPAGPNDTLLLLGGGLAKVASIDIRRPPSPASAPASPPKASASCPTTTLNPAGKTSTPPSSAPPDSPPPPIKSPTKSTPPA